jgi:eukaryotic-like serine/threonine-protein kinase
LRGEREVIEATRTLLGKPTPCVGRERELALLDGEWAECVEAPVARAVLVTASAGAGKSRLIAEFLRRRKAEGDDIAVWIGRGDPLSAGSAFAILAQALRRTVGILDGEPIAVRLHKLRANVARHVPPADRARVAEFLGELIGSESTEPSDMLRAARQSSTLMHDQMRRAWEDFIAAECAAHPVVIVLEDLQWGDPATIKFVSAALRRAAQLPLLVLAIARAEITQLFPGLFAGKHSTHLQLGELSPRAGEKLIRAVLGDVSPALVARIVERAAGNAFFLEELIRAVAEGKGDALPETVLAMMQVWIDALEPATRRVLRAASVFGHVFWTGGLAALLGETAGDSGAALDELTERELIEPRGEGKFPGELEYAFRHAIVRDAAYSLLTDDDRALGHRLAGEWLVRRGEQDAIALADHFHSGGDHERACQWYVGAASDALDANDFDGTLARVERGLACGAAGEQRGRLLRAAEEAQLWRGEIAAAAALGEEALPLLPVGTPAWYDAAGMLARLSASLGKKARSIEIANLLIEHGLDPHNDHCVLAWVTTALRLQFVCEYAVASRLLGPLTAIANDPDASHNARGAVLEVIAHRRQIDGQLDEALRLTMRSVEEYRAAGNIRDAYYEQIGVALAQIELGAYADAVAVMREITSAADALAIPTVARVCKLNLGPTLAYLGSPEAEAIEREALAELVAAGDHRLGTSARTYLTWILTAAGKLDDAIACGLEAEQLARDADPFHRAAIGARLAQALLAAGRAAEALPRALEAARLLAEIGSVEEGESVIHLVHVEALLASGDVARGRTALAAAIARLDQRASRITEASWRASFLERVPENARLRELARQHGV